jgi:hypothetical protein
LFPEEVNAIEEEKDQWGSFFSVGPLIFYVLEFFTGRTSIALPTY